MSKYNRIMNFMNSTAWAIVPEKLEAICNFISAHESQNLSTVVELEKNANAQRNNAAASRDSVAGVGFVKIINVFGAVSPRANMMTEMSGGVSAEKLDADLRMSDADPDIKVILLNIDSPGGAVTGVPELAQTIYNLKTHTIAFTNGMAASAAYWLASQADELVITPSGQVGSIGVVSVHMDATAAYAAEGLKPTILSAPSHKFEGTDMEPLSSDTKNYMMSQIHTFYSMFVKDVARGRGVSRNIVRGESWGQGRMLLAQDAVRLGMADRVATLNDVLKNLGGNIIAPSNKTHRAEQFAVMESSEANKKEAEKLQLDLERLSI